MRMMSRCFNWFPIGGYRRTQYITSIGLFYKNWGFYLEVFLGGCNMITKPKLDLGIHCSSKRVSCKIAFGFGYY